MTLYMKFLKDNKDLINQGEWGELLKKLTSEPEHWDLEDINAIFKILRDAKLPITPEKLLEKYPNRILNYNSSKDPEVKFFEETSLNNVNDFIGMNLFAFHKSVKNLLDFDFEDINIDTNIRDKTIIGSSIYVIVDGTYIEIGIDVYEDKERTELLGSYYIFNYDIALNTVNIKEIGIGYDKNLIRQEFISLINNILKGANN